LRPSHWRSGRITAKEEQSKEKYVKIRPGSWLQVVVLLNIPHTLPVETHQDSKF
jgi:hypothetical protein